MTTAVERAPIHESSVRSDAGSSATFLLSAPSWPIASWTEDYKRHRHATADKRIEGGPQMTRTSPANSARVTRRSFAAGAGAAGLLAASVPLDFAPAIFKELGLPELAIMNADTETNVEVARARAEKLINDGAQLLVGAFDSGQTTAIAQVAEQKGIPFVINIAAAPPITEQGYKFVFRNFPTAPMILSDAFTNQKELFDATGVAPKSVVFMHANDTFGTSMQQGISAVMPRFNMPYKIVEQIAYDPTARDLSVEVAKA